MKMSFKLLTFVIIILALPEFSFAGAVSCGCYCGKVLSPPCSDDACKRACGWKEPSSGGSGKSGGSTGTSTPTYDYEAERQRQEQERLRQEEEQRRIEKQKKKEEAEAKRKQEEFEKNKADALKSMKGIVDNELGLKGTETSNEFGLKGIDEGKQDFGLKGIEDSKKDALKDSSSSGHYDPNVVDLRDKKEPLVVDPKKVKGTTKSASKTAEKTQTDNKVILPTEADLMMLFNTPEIRRKTIEQIFALLNEPKKSVFPKNPEPKLINPLSEPEKWAAFLEKEKTRLYAEAKEKGIFKDPKLAKKLDDATARIIAKEEKTINAASEKYFKETIKQFEQLRKKTGIKDNVDFEKKEKEDPKFKKQVQVIIDSYWNKVAEASIEANYSSRKAMEVEIIELEKEAGKK